MVPSSAPAPYFRPEFFRFLSELSKHNERTWFQANKARFERDVRDPSFRFVREVGPKLGRFSRQIVADDRPVGGSISRIYRDIRFSKDKRPYKTHVGIHFFHRATGDEEGSLPGFYLHLSPEERFVATGMWGPDPARLNRIRSAIVDDPAGWKKATRAGLVDHDDALKRVPEGFDAASVHADDLRRRSFIASRPFATADVTSARFPTVFLARCAELDPLNRFLASAIALDY